MILRGFRAIGVSFFPFYLVPDFVNPVNSETPLKSLPQQCTISSQSYVRVLLCILFPNHILVPLDHNILKLANSLSSFCKKSGRGRNRDPKNNIKRYIKKVKTSLSHILFRSPFFFLKKTSLYMDFVFSCIFIKKSPFLLVYILAGRVCSNFIFRKVVST